MKRAALFVVLACLAGRPVLAQSVPGAVLDAEYENCLKEAAGGTDAQRIAYCRCIRDHMATWTVDTYARVATDVMNAGTGSSVLGQLAKECLPKTIR
jgi:hypothetical protein